MIRLLPPFSHMPDWGKLDEQELRFDWGYLRREKIWKCLFEAQRFEIKEMKGYCFCRKCWYKKKLNGFLSKKVFEPSCISSFLCVRVLLKRLHNHLSDAIVISCKAPSNPPAGACESAAKVVYLHYMQFKEKLPAYTRKAPHAVLMQIFFVPKWICLK